jgi:hypothetical protein
MEFTFVLLDERSDGLSISGNRRHDLTIQLKRAPCMEFDDRKPLRDNEYPEPDDADENGSETIQCPHCGASIYEEAFECPYCGEYVTPSTSPWAGRPLWWLMLAGLGVIMTILMLSCVM